MTTTRFTFAWIVIGLAIAAPIRAQLRSPAQTITQTNASQPYSGDAWIDRRLADINVYGARYRGAFIDELVRYHAAPRELIDELLIRRNWLPADIYYACTVAQIVGKPCRQVTELWTQAQAEGWQAVTKQAGMTAPDALSRVRSDIKESYTRWGRPLAVQPNRTPTPTSSTPATDGRANKQKQH